MRHHNVIDYRSIRSLIVDQFVLPTPSIHGPAHWHRVEEIALRIARDIDADRDVVRLFALYHDARRESDGSDPDHGVRGAQLAEAHRGRFFEISDGQFDLLHRACAEHTDGSTTKDPTIAACWDADRLDLARLGIEPNRRYLSTSVAKREDFQAWAWKLSADTRRQIACRRRTKGRHR